jgi:hypothetical protein
MLASPRLRRRLFKLTLLVAVVGGVAGSFVLWPNTADRSTIDAPLSDEPAVVAVEPPSVRLTPAAREAALATAKRFVGTAVARENVEDSWALVHPSLRQGLTRREWSTGDIPVTPYPVDSARWRLGYSAQNAVGLEVIVLPKAGSELRSMVFDLELKALGTGSGRRWLVSSWAPHGAAGAVAAPRSPQREAAVRAERERWERLRLPVAWLLLPVAIVGGLLAVPVTLRVRDRRRDRRGELKARAHREARRS